MGLQPTSSKAERALTEALILDRLLAGELALPQLDLRWSRAPKSRSRELDAEAKLRVDGKTIRFAVEIKTRSTPRVFAEALARLRVNRGEPEVYPLLVMPYLAPERLAALRGASISGIDLSGNASITVPGKVFIYVSGSPNRFPASDPIKNVYSGATSLVARALLVRPRSASLADMDEIVRARGGALTLTTISKALRRMEDDVLIERKGGSARLLQADRLLDRLAEGFREPKVSRRFVARASLPPTQLAKRLNESGVTWVMTGQSSTEQYAVMPREEMIRIYCTSLPAARTTLEGLLTETDRFPDVELRETDDQTVAFDARMEKETRYASPVQTYLELMRGDKREQETAIQVRELILRETKSAEGK